MPCDLISGEREERDGREGRRERWKSRREGRKREAEEKEGKVIAIHVVLQCIYMYMYIVHVQATLYMLEGVRKIVLSIRKIY